MMVLSLFRLGTFTGGSFPCGPKRPRRRLGPYLLSASCSPWLLFDAEINGCLERGARENAVSLAGRT